MKRHIPIPLRVQRQQHLEVGGDHLYRGGDRQPSGARTLVELADRSGLTAGGDRIHARIPQRRLP